MGESRFQSTHPSRGATYRSQNQLKFSVISIHAPLTGCDLPGWDVRGVPEYFNPRTPHGVRPAGSLSTACTLTISIHAPLTGCDTRIFRGNLRIYISIHAPLTGCDLNSADSGRCCINFNPRTPHGVRPVTANVFGVIFDISIHAPLTGCDIACACRSFC